MPTLGAVEAHNNLNKPVHQLHYRAQKMVEAVLPDAYVPHSIYIRPAICLVYLMGKCQTVSTNRIQ